MIDSSFMKEVGNCLNNGWNLLIRNSNKIKIGIDADFLLRKIVNRVHLDNNLITI